MVAPDGEPVASVSAYCVGTSAHVVVESFETARGSRSFIPPSPKPSSTSRCLSLRSNHILSLKIYRCPDMLVLFRRCPTFRKNLYDAAGEESQYPVRRVVDPFHFASATPHIYLTTSIPTAPDLLREADMEEPCGFHTTISPLQFHPAYSPWWILTSALTNPVSNTQHSASARAPGCHGWPFLSPTQLPFPTYRVPIHPTTASLRLIYSSHPLISTSGRLCVTPLGRPWPCLPSSWRERILPTVPRSEPVCAQLEESRSPRHGFPPPCVGIRQTWPHIP